MTKKDYIKLVEVINAVKADQDVLGTVQVTIRRFEDELTKMLAEDNPKFKLSTFRKAIGRSDY